MPNQSCSSVKFTSLIFLVFLLYPMSLLTQSKFRTLIVHYLNYCNAFYDSLPLGDAIVKTKVWRYPSLFYNTSMVPHNLLGRDKFYSTAYRHFLDLGSASFPLVHQLVLFHKESPVRKHLLWFLKNIMLFQSSEILLNPLPVTINFHFLSR